jgi:hypothetical protein
MSNRTPILIGLLALVAAPLAGGLIGGLNPAFFEFPPLTRYIQHAPFSWPVFGVFAAAALAGFALLARPGWFGFGHRISNFQFSIGNWRFPSWGWIGLFLNIISWACAWGRFPWLGILKDHMFFPLWLGYILVMDGLVFRRTGSSLLSRSPRDFIALFPASAVAWWYFEYLNRFMQNWWYEGSESFSALHYVIFATLCFSTVLPAIFETAEWLSSFAWFRTAYANGPRWSAVKPSALVAVISAGILGLTLLAMFPNAFFFMTWLAPLAILAGVLGLAGVPTPFSDLKDGDYSRLFTLAVAALVCGFFWEMWNFFSMPKWHYAVPYVTRWKIFEMPAAGYAGYLPFGPICWCLWEIMRRLWKGNESCPSSVVSGGWSATEPPSVKGPVSRFERSDADR